MTPLPQDLRARLRGSVRDARTGNAVHAQLTVASTGQIAKTQDDGAFALELPAGRYQVIISAPTYVTQTKALELAPGEVVVFNIDLAPKR